ncbi:MAG: hypothetical protein FD122_1363 [Stygiobacter sp.]|nr:MAG: hypothetical protein FD122_1363 [Stygiobacter sp.]KAF0217993.1 MAG: hypothetical protein FD178_227 [Ignavibacteria bacterium]
MIRHFGVNVFGKPAFAGFLILLVISASNLSAQGDWYFTSSVQLSGGSYILDSYNRVFSVFGGLRYQEENFGISASIPIVFSDNKEVNQISGMVISSGVNNTSALQSSASTGLGDLYSYLDYKIISDYETGVDVIMNAQIKLPTANANMNIGTGKLDFGGSVTLRKSLESFVGIVDLGFLNVGDPDSITYKNPFTYGIGIGKFFNYGEYSMLLYYTGYTIVIEGFDAPRQVSLGVNYRTSEKIILSVISSAGIGNTSPDFTLSGGIRVQL